jgi:hypothetical protein
MDLSITLSCTAGGVVMSLNAELRTQLFVNGYQNMCEIDGMVCATMRFIYTVGVCYGIDSTGYRGRFCFESYQCAELFLKDWDGKTLPVIGEDGCKAIK